MSLLNYFKRKAPQDFGEFLPNPMESSSIRYLQENEQFAVNGFKEAGIFDVLTK